MSEVKEFRRRLRGTYAQNDAHLRVRRERRVLVEPQRCERERPSLLARLLRLLFGL